MSKNCDEQKEIHGVNLALSKMSTGSLWGEVSLQLYLGWQIALIVFLNKTVDIVTLYFVAQLGRHHLSSLALASVVSNIFGESIVVAFGMLI
jgi:hypothetical protein